MLSAFALICSAPYPSPATVTHASACGTAPDVRVGNVRQVRYLRLHLHLPCRPPHRPVTVPIDLRTAATTFQLNRMSISISICILDQCHMAANLFVPVTCNPRFHNVSRLAALTGSEMTTFGNGPRCAARVGENAVMTSSRGHGIRISSDTGVAR